MQTETDPDLTLPSLIASMAGRYGTRELALTIVFHPDTSRIGRRAVVPRKAGQRPWILGRRSPSFSGPDSQDAVPLDDPHVSRRALQFEFRSRQITVSRFDGSSRCRLGGSELHDSVTLDWDQLANGVPLLLGHSIVLLLCLESAGLQPSPELAFDGELLGSSSPMLDIRSQIERAAESDLDVLIRGETGTGKELVASAIHRASRRGDAPMVRVNMAAVPRELAAAALFGSVRGAFTGAERASPGFFGQAEGGTLFLDEIGDTPSEVQPLLLRALQQREVQVVGGAVRKVDIRVISATDSPLEGDDNSFRSALRYRLGALEINLPPLRNHPQDIGELLLCFLNRAALESRCVGLLPHTRSSAPHIAAWAALFYTFLEYSWPGNVRQLENFANQVVLSSEHTPTISDDLRKLFRTARAHGPGDTTPTRRRKLQDIDEHDFDRAMVENGFEVKRVAGQLGVSRAAVYRRIASSTRYRLAHEITPRELGEALQVFGRNEVRLSHHFRVPLNSLRGRLRDLELDP